MLSLSVRPLTSARMVRCYKLLIFLRHYTERRIPVVLDHGFLQKVWSILVDAEHYSRPRLECVMTGMKPFAADCIVWVTTPVELAALRIAGRSHGNSRFEGHSARKIKGRLAPKVCLLEELVRLFEQSTQTDLLLLDGQAPAEDNARRIDELLHAHTDGT